MPAQFAVPVAGCATAFLTPVRRRHTYLRGSFGCFGFGAGSTSAVALISR